jgi:hypothetical protein
MNLIVQFGDRLLSGLVTLVSLASVWLILTGPSLVEACAVCSAGREDESRTAFIIGTAFMTALPMILVGGLVWWIRKKTREAASLAQELDPVSEA